MIGWLELRTHPDAEMWDSTISAALAPRTRSSSGESIYKAAPLRRWLPVRLSSCTIAPARTITSAVIRPASNPPTTDTHRRCSVNSGPA